MSLMDEMKKGMQLCREELSGVGFDTWGVDCGLIDKEGNMLALPGSYRDVALDDANMAEALEKIGGEEYAFEQTGIASLAYNTLYKLYYMKKNMPSIMESADKMLLMPNFIEYLFSGAIHTEYSIASTTQLYDMREKRWAKSLIQKIGLPDKLLLRLIWLERIWDCFAERWQRKSGRSSFILFRHRGMILPVRLQLFRQRMRNLHSFQAAHGR